MLSFLSNYLLIIQLLSTEVIPVDGNNGAKRAAVGEGRTPKTTEVLVDLTSDSEDELPLKRKVPQPKISPASIESISKSDDNYSTSNGKILSSTNVASSVYSKTLFCVFLLCYTISYHGLI